MRSKTRFVDKSNVFEAICLSTYSSRLGTKSGLYLYVVEKNEQMSEDAEKEKQDV